MLLAKFHFSTLVNDEKPVLSGSFVEFYSDFFKHRCEDFFAERTLGIGRISCGSAIAGHGEDTLSASVVKGEYESGGVASVRRVDSYA